MPRRKRTSRKRKRLVNTLDKPWCFYCDRTFENEQVLHSHQRARHFTCPHCQRKFALALSLGMHMYQTHDEQLNHVFHALQDRGNPRIPISGMNGIPKDAILERYGRMYLEEHDESNRMEIASRVHDLGADLQRLLREVDDQLSRSRANRPENAAHGRKKLQEEEEAMDQSTDEVPNASEASKTQHAPTLKAGAFVQSTKSAGGSSGPPQTIFVYPNDDLSMEEKRAQEYAANGGVRPLSEDRMVDTKA